MSEYFKPRTKDGLVAWLCNYWPEDRAAFERKTKGVLSAIYNRVIADIRLGKYPGSKGGSK